MPKKVSSGTAHMLPADLKKNLILRPRALAAWESLTPLARNEWICWVESAKRQETREDHVKRTIVELIEGKRRPCCWLGCIHRADKPMSASQKWVLAKRSKRS